MTENMIEKATLAVVEVWQKSNNLPGSTLDCQAVARAVIEAMKEPTEKMHAAGTARDDGGDRTNSIGVYRSMIDAALIWPAGSADKAGVPMARD